MITDEAERIVNLPKHVPEKILWRSRPQSPNSYRFKVDVLGFRLGVTLQLVGVLGPETWSFVLLANNHVKLRRISTPKNPHPNPDGTLIDPYHKHRWTTEHEDRLAYIPDDILWDNHHTVLMSFARECHIDLLHPPEMLRVQGRLL